MTASDRKQDEIERGAGVENKGLPPHGLKELIERLEKATGPDRVLDAEIAVASGLYAEQSVKHGKKQEWVSKKKGGAWVPSLDYTASLDAALTLVPESGCWLVENDARRKHQPRAWVRHAPAGSRSAGRGSYAATPVLALCVAALKAHSHQSETQKRRGK